VAEAHPVVIRRTVRLEPRPGDLIRGDVRVPEGPPPRSAIVVVHGFKGFKDWGFFPHVCDRLAASGHGVVSFNLSHNGVGEDLLEFTELDRFGANTLSLELDDVLFMVDQTLAGEVLPFRPRSVCVLGHSRGGGQAVLAAAADDRIDAIATWAAVSDFDRWSPEVKDEWRADGRIWILNSRTGQQMPLDVGLLEDFEAHRARLDIGAAAAAVEVPWLIVHGRNDETVSVDEGRALARAARQGRLVLVDGAGHTFEARHPFAGSTPQLDQALDATVAHFEPYLAG
jgi:dienelactone hydrolase